MSNTIISIDDMNLDLIGNLYREEDNSFTLYVIDKLTEKTMIVKRFDKSKSVSEAIRYTFDYLKPSRETMFS